jgi:hypothetical protein
MMIVKWLEAFTVNQPPQDAVTADAPGDLR